MTVCDPLNEESVEVGVLFHVLDSILDLVNANLAAKRWMAHDVAAHFVFVVDLWRQKMREKKSEVIQSTSYRALIFATISG